MGFWSGLRRFLAEDGGEEETRRLAGMLRAALAEAETGAGFERAMRRMLRRPTGLETEREWQFQFKRLYPYRRAGEEMGHLRGVARRYLDDVERLYPQAEVSEMLRLREAAGADLDFLVGVDREDEGVTPNRRDEWGPAEVRAHRAKIAGFVSDGDKAAWVFEDTDTGRLIGMILWRYRNRRQEAFAPWDIFPELDEALFPADGAFAEVFQLWVAPAYRRRGLATHLKRQAELEALARGVGLIYTHTEARNGHVIEMNRKLGYREVRRGPIWDEVVRVSLVKTLGPDA